MDLTEKLKALAAKAESNKTTLLTEEATKQALIVPFFAMLGYDVFDPTEFIPEFIADVGNKKGEKVDYAIMIDGKPQIIVEAKMIGMSLDKFGNQITRYFAFTESKFGILTDGVEYRFYTDIDDANKLDKTPFFVFRLSDLRPSDISEIEKFQKSTFNAESIYNTAENLKYTTAIESFVKTQFDNPSDDFIRYLISKVYKGKKVQSAIDKFQPIVKRSLKQFIDERVNERFKSAMDGSGGGETIIPPTPEVEEEPPKTEVVDDTPKVETTLEELEAYGIIKAMLKDVLPAEKIDYKDTIYYFSIEYDGKRTKWICRLVLKDNLKYIVIPSDDEDARKHNIGYGKRYELESVNSLYDLSDLIVASAKRFVE